MTLRRIVAGLAAGARLAAALSCSGTTTISTQAEATGLSACSTFDGELWIGKNTKEDIDLAGITKITGSLLANDIPKMTSLSADNLASITDTFGLKDITALTSLSFPSLTSVDSIYWEGLPSLSYLTFTQGVSKANILSIQNTNLASLDGIDLDSIDQLYLANNFFLEDVSMPIESVSTALAMAANGRNLKVDFPNLEVAFNMTFRNVSSLNIPSLAAVNGSMGFYSNFFDSVEAPNLTIVGKDLSFVSNGALTSIDMPLLKELGGSLQLANNTHLSKVDGFPKLASVNGAVEMYGHFTSVTLPKLSLVRGAFNLQSSEDLGSSCNRFSSIAGPNEDIRGKFYCQGGVEDLPGESASGSSDSGANALLIPYATGIIGIVAAIFGML